jgi:S-adenosylmethionine hydrolase
VVARGGGHCFVGPDNGLLEVVARRCPRLEARQIDPAKLGLSVPSRTFHGRDLFAPVAAKLALGVLAFEEVGREHSLLVTANVPEPELGAGNARGAVVVIDHFGNLVTNLSAAELPRREGLRVRVAAREVPVVSTFADVAPGAPAALVGSFGALELFVRNGSAAALFSAERGTRVDVSW